MNPGPRRPPPKTATPRGARMRDVAARSGVSEATVSHVINGTKAISAATRERVERAMRELDYHRDSSARRLARGHSDVLGLVISDIENPFYPGLIKAFESGALAAGHEVLLCATGYDAGRTELAFRRMIEQKVPGVAVMTSRVDPRMARILADQGVASVFLDGAAAGPRRGIIRMDYALGARQAVQHLHGLGHRAFALLAGPQQRASHAAYRQAVEEALAGLGATLQIVVGDNDAASGAGGVQRLLAGAAPPTAILCSNDLTALSALRTLAGFGRRVPADVSVVGADDIPFAALSLPALTTVRMPRQRLGALAAGMLLELCAASGRSGAVQVVETELVIRETSGPAPRA